MSRTAKLGLAAGDAGLCVCVPARNEELHLPLFLDALAVQDVDGVIPIAIGLNNTTDRSMAVIEAAQARWQGRLSIEVETVTFAADLAHAGSARRHAMALGAHVVEHQAEAVLISTDADSRPPKTWISANLLALKAGADIVGGRLEIDEGELATPLMTKAHRLMDRYWTEVRAIEDSLDPVSWDPAPRHGDHTGASLAMRLKTWLAAGGVPAIASGEDRALVRAAIATGARLCHPPSVWTLVSARLKGRADGGMAGHLAALDASLTAGRGLMVPSFQQWRERAQWRRDQRQAGMDAGALAALEQALPSMKRDMTLGLSLMTS